MLGRGCFSIAPGRIAEEEVAAIAKAAVDFVRGIGHSSQLLIHR